MKRVTVGDVLDHPIFGPKLMREIEDLDYESDMRVLRICQENGRPVPKSVWKRIVKHRRKRRGEARPEDGR